MHIVAYISRGNAPVAEATYRPGLFVEVRVAKEFQDLEIDIPLQHSENGRLAGTWELSLDRYFNEGLFDSRDTVFRGEMPRCGAAREHKSLFHKASYSLKKDLERWGYTVEIEFI
ncbi:MAG: hypothetical protein AB1646_15850 [Thermodesulfobacteriota bacterium]